MNKKNIENFDQSSKDQYSKSKKPTIQDKFEGMFDEHVIYKRKFTDEDLKCKSLTPSQCEELRNMKFSNEPEDLFLEVRSLEERYQYEISKTEENWDKRIENEKEKDLSRYQKKVENRKKEIEYEIHRIKEAIETNITALETQENMILSQIDMTYKLNKDKLIEKALEIIKFNFLEKELEE